MCKYFSLPNKLHTKYYHHKNVQKQGLKSINEKTICVRKTMWKKSVFCCRNVWIALIAMLSKICKRTCLIQLHKLLSIQGCIAHVHNHRKPSCPVLTSIYTLFNPYVNCFKSQDIRAPWSMMCPTSPKLDVALDISRTKFVFLIFQ